MKHPRSVIPQPDRIDQFVYWFGLAGFAALAWAVADAVPEAFQFSPSWYSVFAAGSVIANTWLLIVLARRPVQGEPMVWLSLFIFFNMLWGAAEFMHRLMLTPIGNAFWSHIEFAIVAFIPTMLYLFIRSYTTRSTISDTWRIPVVFVAGAATVAFLISADGVLPVMPWSAHEAWGYPAPATPASYIFIAWCAIISLGAIARLVVAYADEPDPRRRKPLMWLAVSAAVLTASEALTAIILPALGFGAIPPLGVLANTVMAVGIIYTIVHYRAFSVTIGQLADAVLQGLGEAVFVTDQAGKLVYANAAAEHILSTPQTHVIGTSLHRLSQGAFNKVLRAWHKRPTNQKDHPFEVSLASGGRELTLNVRIADADQAGWGHAFVLSDITSLRAANQRLLDSQAELAASLRRAQELEQQLRREKASVEHKVAVATATLRSEHARLVTSINSLSLGLVMTDAKGEFVTVNQQTQAVLAKSLGLAHGTLAVEPASLKGPLDRQFGLSAKIATCLATRRAQRYPATDIGDRLIEVSVSPILDDAAAVGPALGAVALIEDVTDAQNLERARDEFFSIASHELRTPLTAIRGNSGMLLELPEKELSGPQSRDMLGDVHDASVRLIKIVNDFLDVAQVEQDKVAYKLEPVDVPALVQDIGDQVRPTVPQAVSLELHLPKASTRAIADSKRLRQVITELIDNAVKHTEAGSVSVSVSTLSERVVVSVTDTGSGIEPDHRHLLFRKFQLASENIFTRDATRSTGLGLYLARRLAHGMGGQLELAESTPGVGSTFALTLPLSTKSEKTSPKASEA